MKYFYIVALALVAVFAEEVFAEEISDENVDISAIVRDENALKDYADCFTDKKDCNEKTAPFKKVLPESLKQACANCSKAQKHNVNEFLNALKKKLPNDYNDIRAKYDPENKYFEKLEAAIATY